MNLLISRLISQPIVYVYVYIYKFNNTKKNKTKLCTGGRVTAFKEGEPGHTLSFNCKLHTGCRILKLYKKMPAGYKAPRLIFCQWFVVDRI